MQNKICGLVAGCFAIMLGGCELANPEVQKYWQTVDGSKTNGTVTLAYEVWGREIAIISDAQGISEARRACKNWGYNGASPFSSAESECTSEYSIYGYNTLHKRCKAWRVTKKYQCRQIQEDKARASSQVPASAFPVDTPLSFDGDK